MFGTRRAIDRAQYMGIFFVALAGLAYQVLLTRIFSVMLYYHFAFAGVSLAMLGMTIGAMQVYGEASASTEKSFADGWIKAALMFSVSGVMAIPIFMYLPQLAELILPRQSLTVVLSVLLPFAMLFFVVPFTYCGICITLLLTRASLPVNQLYAWDLAGAAIGCLAIVGAMFVLDPISILFCLGGVVAASAWFMATKSGSSLKPLALYCMGALFALGLAHGTAYLTGMPVLKLEWAKNKYQGATLFERWNVFSRVVVTPRSPETSRIPSGWGFGSQPTMAAPEQVNLSIDADAGTVITRFDTHDITSLRYLQDDIINAGYFVRPAKDVAVIGVGGGRDILSALTFGATRVTGIEINPAIFEALTDKFADFSGNLHRRNDVRLVNAEARSWLAASSEHFDLIQISLIDTWAATAAGGLTLTENKLYTIEAWQEFLHRLTPEGVLTVSRWFDAETHQGEFYRLLALATEALRKLGVPATEMRRHILALNARKIITVIVSRGGFADAEIPRITEHYKKAGFTIMADPTTAWDATSLAIVSGQADANFYRNLPYDVSAPTDDRPFFFYMKRLSDGANLDIKKQLENNEVAGIFLQNNFAVSVIFWLFCGVLVLCAVFVILPLLDRSRLPMTGESIFYLLYFSGIGIGFMLIEISQMQRLMIFLGHPVYGLVVVLFTLLLFGGLGSLLAGWRHMLPAWGRPAALCVVLLLTGLATPFVTDGLKAYDTVIRVVASVVLLAPAGLFMGMMFPLGMAYTRRLVAQQPWFWGINGATSVLASIMGVAISMEYGIAATYMVGVACYVFCALILLLRHRDLPLTA